MHCGKHMLAPSAIGISVAGGGPKCGMQGLAAGETKRGLRICVDGTGAVDGWRMRDCKMCCVQFGLK